MSTTAQKFAAAAAQKCTAGSGIASRWTGEVLWDSSAEFPPDDVWRFHMSGETDGSANQLFVTRIDEYQEFADQQETASVLLSGDETAEWQDIHFDPGSRFMIWYQPPEQGILQQYLLSDEPVPGVKSDLRIDRRAFAGIGDHMQTY